tara:strand:- start:321 stop:848 length:528 start_codon:yes stop_codon:yes gene_type:complete
MAKSLEFINRTDITSASANVVISNVFSSKYDKYKIVFSNLTSIDSSGTHLSLRFHDGSSTITSNYNYCLMNQSCNISATAQVSSSNSYILRFFGEMDGASGQCTSGVGYVFNPFGSGYTFAQSMSAQDTSKNSGTSEIRFSHGVLRNSSSMTGFVLHNPNRNYDEGTIITYGILE